MTTLQQIVTFTQRGISPHAGVPFISFASFCTFNGAFFVIHLFFDYFCSMYNTRYTAVVVLKCFRNTIELRSLLFLRRPMHLRPHSSSVSSFVKGLALTSASIFDLFAFAISCFDASLSCGGICRRGDRRHGRQMMTMLTLKLKSSR